MKTQNDLLSKDLKVKALPNNAVAEYILVNAGKKKSNVTDLESGIHKYCSPAGFWLPTEIQINDPGNGNVPILLQSIRGWEPIASKPGEEQKFKPILKPLNFGDNGKLIITDKDKELYIYLERYPTNKSNPFRDRTKAAEFMRVDEQKIIDEEFELNDTIGFIMGKISQCTAAEIELWAAAFKKSGDKIFNVLNLNEPADRMRNRLYNIAKSGENALKMMEYNPDKDLRVRKMIQDLMKINKVYFDANNSRFVVKRKPKETGMRNLGPVIEPGNDKFEFIVEWLNNEKDAYDQVEELLSLHRKFYDQVLE